MKAFMDKDFLLSNPTAARLYHEFAEVTPVKPVRCGNVAVTVRIAGAEADIHSGADAATVETVLRILKLC